MMSVYNPKELENLDFDLNLYIAGSGDNVFFQLGNIELEDAQVFFDLENYTIPKGDELLFQFGEKKVVSPFMLAWQVRGKLLKEGQADPLNVGGIYRVQKIKGTQVVQKMKYYKPENPRTPRQQANRARFRSAMEAWRNLTEEEQNVYNKEAKVKMLFGWNIFIKEYFTMHTLEEFL